MIKRLLIVLELASRAAIATLSGSIETQLKVFPFAVALEDCFLSKKNASYDFLGQLLLQLSCNTLRTGPLPACPWSNAESQPKNNLLKCWKDLASSMSSNMLKPTTNAESKQYQWPSKPPDIRNIWCHQALDKALAVIVAVAVVPFRSHGRCSSCHPPDGQESSISSTMMRLILRSSFDEDCRRKKNFMRPHNIFKSVCILCHTAAFNACLISGRLLWKNRARTPEILEKPIVDSSQFRLEGFTSVCL